MPSEEIPTDGEKYFQFLFENMLEGYALCKTLFDDSGNLIDFTYLKTNKAFETLTGLHDVIGKKVTEIIPRIRQTNPDIFIIYGRVANTGKPETFETKIKQLNLWLKISVYRPGKGYFVAVFDNITESKKFIEQQTAKTHELELMNEAMIGREVKMAELKKRIVELQKQLAECHYKK